MALQTFTIDGVQSTTWNLVISSGGGLFNAPQRSVEKISVPGRNGELILDNGNYGNIQVVYPVFTMENVRNNTDEFRQFVMTHADKYYTLFDTYHPYEFRKARFSGDFVAAMFQGFLASSFSIVFDCKPQRYLWSGTEEQSFTASGTISNPTYFNAEPLIEIFGTGEIDVNGYTVTIGSGSGKPSIKVDSEVMDCYSGVDNMNAFVTLSKGFPTLSPGENNVTIGTGITQVKITPRWWML